MTALPQEPETCVTCGSPTVLAFEIDGAPRRVDASWSDEGELAVVVGKNLVTVFWGVGPEGDDFWGIPADAPRTRVHRCHP